MTFTWNSTKQIGPKRAREMWFLTRFYTASEAEKMGLVNTIVPVSNSSVRSHEKKGVIKMLKH